ncbi:MAG TPA: glycosyl hydrolase family 18 protein [Puia sp.]|nr:glycosyl hydrolase family 18 protein [Puia sp.]
MKFKIFVISSIVFCSYGTGNAQTKNPESILPGSHPFVTAYVEVNDNDFGNVGCYTYCRSGKQLFSIGNIFAANINADPVTGSPVLEFNPGVKAVLNSGKIAQLHSLGIKVLLDVLGNHQNAGWGCFTSYAQADSFAVQCANSIREYDLDGIDIDDEYSACTANDASLVLVVSALRGRIGYSKLITLVGYKNSTYFSAAYKGKRVGDLLDLVIEETYFSNDYSGRLKPFIKAGVPKNKLAIGTHLEDNNQAAVAAYVKDNGLACVMVYGVTDNSKSKLSAISEVLFNSTTGFKNNCINKEPFLFSNIY